MPRPSHVALVGTCPHCHESVELIVSKKQAKAIFKAFKLNIREAQLKGEASIHG